MYRYKHARVHTRVQTQTTHVFLVALITKRSYVRPVTVSAIREANSTWSLNVSKKLMRFACSSSELRSKHP